MTKTAILHPENARHRATLDDISNKGLRSLLEGMDGRHPDIDKHTALSLLRGPGLPSAAVDFFLYSAYKEVREMALCHPNASENAIYSLSNQDNGLITDWEFERGVQIFRRARTVMDLFGVPRSEQIYLRKDLYSLIEQARAKIEEGTLGDNFYPEVGSVLMDDPHLARIAADMLNMPLRKLNLRMTQGMERRVIREAAREYKELRRNPTE
ncbi:MAG: hypothetical protein KGH67_03905 [Candidatus Micrarchaeota archaeon]|nr:hypothetical protein [Candidatus Micrarchaeota archaeon]MDE1859646.1 hypothetical protein [Candidatus Micrarchaeota archaeon]